MVSSDVDFLALIANALLPSPVKPSNFGMVPFKIFGKALSTPQNIATENAAEAKYYSIVIGNTCLFKT
jgi:hypothetical protein